MAGFRDYKEFDAFKLADEAKSRIFKMTSRTAFERHSWLKTQLNKAANSACANHAEGFGRFRPKQFAVFVEIAIGSLTEILQHMADVKTLGLSEPVEHDEICSF